MPQAELDLRGLVRTADPEESWDAAASQSERNNAALRAEIHQLLVRYGPMNDSELWARREKLRKADPARYRQVSEQSLRTRRSELHTAARVRPTGKRRASANGRPSGVWEAIA